MEAFQRPVLGHLDPDFLVVLDEIADRLRAVFQTDERADAADQRHRLGRHGSVLRQPARAGRHRDRRRQRRVRRADVRRRAAAAVPRSCASTSRGAAPSIRSGCSTRSADVPQRAPARGGARRDVDRRRERRSRRSPRCRTPTRCCSSTPSRRSAASRSRSTAWGIDAVYSGHAEVPRRAARARAGQLLATAPSNACAPRETPVQSWYLDLGLLADYVGTARRYHHTAPISMLYALHAGLGVLLDEGLEASWARHRHVGDAAAGRAARARVPAVRRGAAPAAAHVGLAARRRRRRQGARRAAHPLRHRGRRRARRSRRARAGASA